MWLLLLLHCYNADCTHNPEDGARAAFAVETFTCQRARAR